MNVVFNDHLINEHGGNGSNQNAMKLGVPIQIFKL